MRENACSKGRLWLCLAIIGCPLFISYADNSLTLAEYLGKVLQNNESIQIRIIETEVARKQHLAAKGIFEPALVSSFTREDRHRALTEEQKLSILGQNVFNERNELYDTGIEMVTPTGSKLRVGYSHKHLVNNLNRGTFPNGEYLSRVEVGITQPLLKDGFAAVMANIRAAAISSDIAFQDYRKALMDAVTKAETAYWDVFLAQQQRLFANESVRVAEELLKDNRSKLEVGKASDLEVLQAEAGLAERRALAMEAEQKWKEAVNRAMSFCSASVVQNPEPMKALDTPTTNAVTATLLDYRFKATECNPDWLALCRQTSLDEVKIQYARNQKLPNLDLKGSYSSSGIGNGFSGSFEGVGNQIFPEWVFGAELRIPLGGNIKAKHELHAAQMRRESTELAMRSLSTQLDNSIEAALRIVQLQHACISNFQKMVEFNQNLLTTQLARQEVGKTDSRTVLEAERDLFEARLNWAQSRVRYQRAILELQQSSGITLKERNIDLSQGDLAGKTRLLVTRGRVTEGAFDSFLDATRREFERRRANPAPGNP